jgi:hypothetical protein
MTKVKKMFHHSSSADTRPDSGTGSRIFEVNNDSTSGCGAVGGLLKADRINFTVQ